MTPSIPDDDLVAIVESLRNIRFGLSKRELAFVVLARHRVRIPPAALLAQASRLHDEGRLYVCDDIAPETRGYVRAPMVYPADYAARHAVRMARTTGLIGPTDTELPRDVQLPTEVRA